MSLADFGLGTVAGIIGKIVLDLLKSSIQKIHTTHNENKKSILNCIDLIFEDALVYWTRDHTSGDEIISQRIKKNLRTLSVMINDFTNNDERNSGGVLFHHFKRFRDNITDLNGNNFESSKKKCKTKESMNIMHQMHDDFIIQVNKCKINFLILKNY